MSITMQQDQSPPPIFSLPPEIICEIFKLVVDSSHSLVALILSTKRLHAIWAVNEQSICRYHIQNFFNMATEVAFIREPEHTPPDQTPMTQHFETTTALVVPLSLLPPCIADQFLDYRHAFSSPFRYYRRHHHHFWNVQNNPPLPVRRRRNRNKNKEVQVIFHDFWDRKSPGTYTLRSWAGQHEKAVARGMKDGELTLRSVRMWNMMLRASKDGECPRQQGSGGKTI
ncbi:MAG: hypothetical protein Q9207_006614 [Kuettlingeria erythrocarpa]